LSAISRKLVAHRHSQHASRGARRYLAPSPPRSFDDPFAHDGRHGIARGAADGGEAFASDRRWQIFLAELFGVDGLEALRPPRLGFATAAFDLAPVLGMAPSEYLSTVQTPSDAW
jgi:hypothetical protein